LRLTVGTQAAGGNVSVIRGSDTDHVTINNFAIYRDLSINLGDGANTLVMGNVGGAFIGGNTIYEGGSGVDSVLLGDTQINKLLFASLQDGG
jgi:hypothetical protein